MPDQQYSRAPRHQLQEAIHAAPPRAAAYQSQAQQPADDFEHAGHPQHRDEAGVLRLRQFEQLR